jgi:translation initiation factor 1 (eIF-1/SUI1)
MGLYERRFGLMVVMGTNLGDLLRQAGLKPSEDISEAGEPQPTAESAAPQFADKLVVRFSRKGRKGHTVTIVSGVLTEHQAVLVQLRRHMGLGGRVDGDDLILQGNQVERVARWFESQGVKKVVR